MSVSGRHTRRAGWADAAGGCEIRHHL